MAGIVHLSLGEVGDALVVLDARRRVYVAVSRDGSYLHVVSPAQVDSIDVDGNVTRRAGELECRCKGAIFRGTCYRLEEALAFEGSAGPVWARDAAPGELMEAYGK